MKRLLAGIAFLVPMCVIASVPHGARPVYAVAASVTCPTQPGNYVAGGTLSAATNTYWQPPGSLAAGATSVSLGTIDTTGGGASTGVKTGDELLIMQMQDGNTGNFNSSNSSSYGDGSGTGHGLTSPGNAGLYEYVSVASASSTQTTGTVTVQGSGAGGGLLNSYYEDTTHNRRYQIIRVPQYTTATLSGNFKAAYWDGKTGGVAAIDMASTLNLGGASIYATGDGFRGGALSYTSTSPPSVLNTDYTDSAQMNGSGVQPAFGSKGEGIMGAPGATFYYSSFATPSAPSSPGLTTIPGANPDGYTGGDQGRGAPGNAGGGGDDDDPSLNKQNSGGGGGANGGDGGNGGYPWTPSYSGTTPLYSQQGVHTAPGTGYSAFNSADIGGRGGANLSSYVSVSRVFMGGGGGAGANDNHSENNSYNNYGSSGGVGGGIVLMRLADTSGAAATIYANGTTGLAPDNDGGGGGGAGGTVVITSPQAFSNITVNVNGAAGTTAAATSSDNTYNIQHGPGGGGGGGVVITSSAVTASNAGGANGTTTTFATSYGATSGSSGVTMNGTVTTAQVPGIGSGSQCFVAPVAGTSTLYTGPYDSTDSTPQPAGTPSNAPYYGASDTGSYDGAQTASSNNDFTARAIPFSTASPAPVLIDNSSTGSALSPVGNTFTLARAPTNQIEHSLWYLDSTVQQLHTITLKAVAPILPAQWTVQICPDNGSNQPNCSFTATYTTCTTTSSGQWISSVAASAATNTLKYCYYSAGAKSGKPPAQSQSAKYWTVYTGPTGTYTAFARYDGYIDAQDDQATPADNKTHDELYAGFIPVGKSYTVVNKGICSGTMASPPPTGVCPHGIVQYSLNYANIVAGAGMGTEGQLTSLFPASGAGTLKISDSGSASGANWSTYTSGLTESLAAGLSSTTQAGCGITAGDCGDSTAGTTCTYNGGGAFVSGATTSFVCTIGGASGRLYPAGLTGTTSSGSLVFAVKVK